MGLDTYAVRRAASGEWELAPKEAFQGIHLGVGPYTDAMSNSFQGKVFDGLVTRLTDQSLFQEIIEPKTVRAMFEQLAATPYSEVAETMERLFPKVPEERWRNLIRFFELCAEKGYGLMGSW